MRQNLTISLSKDLIKKARVLAAQRQTSISQMLSDQLTQLVNEAEQYEWAKKKALVNLEKGFHLGGKKLVSREELHER